MSNFLLPACSNYYYIEHQVAIELRKIILDAQFLKAISRASSNATSELESFHAAINRAAPKAEGFSHRGMSDR